MARAPSPSSAAISVARWTPGGSGARPARPDHRPRTRARGAPSAAASPPAALAAAPPPAPAPEAAASAAGTSAAAGTSRSRRAMATTGGSFSRSWCSRAARAAPRSGPARSTNAPRATRPPQAQARQPHIVSSSGSPTPRASSTAVVLLRGRGQAVGELRVAGPGAATWVRLALADSSQS